MCKNRKKSQLFCQIEKKPKKAPSVMSLLFYLFAKKYHDKN